MSVREEERPCKVERLCEEERPQRHREERQHKVLLRVVFANNVFASCKYCFYEAQTEQGP